MRVRGYVLVPDGTAKADGGLKPPRLVGRGWVTSSSRCPSGCPAASNNVKGREKEGCAGVMFLSDPLNFLRKVI